MSEAQQVEAIPHLADFGNVVPDGYLYHQKLVVPRQDLSLPNAYFKWYDIRPPEVEITAEQTSATRAFVAAEAARLNLANELGFVLLHRAGPYLLLLITTWRNTNEIWESVYAKEAESAAEYAPIEFANSHRGTFCVWELGPIWHERHAWVRFLASRRDAAAKLAYISDRFAGMV
jgi:hypothetical protein